MTIINKIKELREKYPYKTALVDIKTKDKLTFSHMDIKSDKICTYFEKNGFKKGDKIVVFMPEGTDFYLILLAILKMGFVAVIIDSHKEAEYIDKCCGVISADGIISDKMTLLKGILLKNIRKIKKKISYKKIIETSENLPAIIKKKPKKYEREEKETDENTPALITFTNESGEFPKAVMGTHGFLLGQYNILEKNMNFSKETKVYSLFPLFILSHVLTGTTTFISDADSDKPEEIKYRDIIKQISENGIQNIVLPVELFENIIEYALGKNIILKNVQTAYITGIPIFPKTMEKIKNVFINAEIKAFFGISGIEPFSILDFSTLTEEDLENMKNGRGLFTGKKVSELEFEIRQTEKESDREKDVQKEEDIHTEDNFVGSTENIYEKAGEIFVRGEHILRGNPNTEENKNRKWYKTGLTGYIDNKNQLVLLGKTEQKINIERKEYYPLAVETAFSFCKVVKKSALTLKEGKLCLILERSHEFKENHEENEEIRKLKDKFGIFKIIEEKTESES